MSEKKEGEVEESKKSSKKKKDKQDESKVKKNLPLRTLIDLVDESQLRRKEIIVKLADNGYLNQFYEEEDKRRIGYPIEPTINENEFKKIIGE